MNHVLAVVHLTDDLIFASRVAGTARALGIDCATARDVPTLIGLVTANGPACAILDLANPGLVLAVALDHLHALPRRSRVVAYGSHVDAAGLHAARVMGCDLVLPRSQFVELLVEELPKWASAAHEK